MKKMKMRMAAVTLALVLAGTAQPVIPAATGGNGTGITGVRTSTVYVYAKTKKKKKVKMVYVTPTGRCYHTHKCGYGTYYKATLASAKARGLRKCRKCYY